MQILISWLLQKPTDLDLHCLQRQDISWFSRTKVKTCFQGKIRKCHCFFNCSFFIHQHTMVLSLTFIKLVCGFVCSYGWRSCQSDWVSKEFKSIFILDCWSQFNCMHRIYPNNSDRHTWVDIVNPGQRAVWSVSTLLVMQTNLSLCVSGVNS